MPLPTPCHQSNSPSKHSILYYVKTGLEHVSIGHSKSQPCKSSGNDSLLVPNLLSNYTPAAPKLASMQWQIQPLTHSCTGSKPLARITEQQCWPCPLLQSHWYPFPRQPSSVSLSLPPICAKFNQGRCTRATCNYQRICLSRQGNCP